MSSVLSNDIYLISIKLISMKKLLYAFAIIYISSCNKNQLDLTFYPDQEIQQLKIEIKEDNISLNQAENIAKLFNIQNRTKSYNDNNIENSFSINNKNNTSQIHIINFENNGGYVIISGTTKYTPIIAYSETGHFYQDYIDTPIEIWLNEQLDKMSYYNTSSNNNTYRTEWDKYEKNLVKSFNLTKSESINSFRDACISNWEAQGHICHPLYEKPDDLPDDVYSRFCQSAEGIAHPDYDYMAYSIILETNITRIDLNTGNFMTSTWNCGGEYAINGHEEFSSEAVAIGQVMNYYDWIIHDNCNCQVDWDIENDNITDIQEFLANIQVNIGSFNISSVKNFLNKHGYHNAQLIDHYNVPVRNDLLSRKPVIMSGGTGNSRHTWLCTGYQSRSLSKEYLLYVISVIPPLQYEYTGLNHHHSSSSGGAHYYMNWGWGGTYNGWYFNEDTTPGNNNYSSNRKDIVNIYTSIGE